MNATIASTFGGQLMATASAAVEAELRLGDVIDGDVTLFQVRKGTKLHTTKYCRTLKGWQAPPTPTVVHLSRVLSQHVCASCDGRYALNALATLWRRSPVLGGGRPTLLAALTQGDDTAVYDLVGPTILRRIFEAAGAVAVEYDSWDRSLRNLVVLPATVVDWVLNASFSAHRLESLGPLLPGDTLTTFEVALHLWDPDNLEDEDSSFREIAYALEAARAI